MAALLCFLQPANAASVRVMHVIAANGSLQTDDFSLSTTVVAPPPGGDNLIANPSFETANGATPAGWSSNSWGTNTANFVYENTGRTGSRSATAALSTYTSGDAKWFATPVNVTAGNNYTYSDFYKSGVTTRLVAAYQNAANAFSYQELGTAPASAAWTQRQVNFTVPAGITKVSIYHVIESVGSLTIDDVNLTAETTPPPVDDENLVPNPSLETANGANPANWQNNKWGTNTANFTYENTGRTGSKSVKTTVSAYTDGDAKWFFAPVSVQPNKTYIYRDYFKSNVPSRVVIAFVDGSGTFTYQEVNGAPAAADWTQYQVEFTTPANAAQATVFHLVSSVGNLTIDDVLLQVAAPSGGGGSIPVPNNSLEQGSGGNPVSWQSSKWGTNGATFQYVTTEGHTGNRSVKVTMNNYTSGDAKWLFDPIESLTPGEQYRFGVWYKGTVVPQAVVLYVLEDGSEQYFGMPAPQTVSSTTWQKYSDTFTVPQNAVAVSAFLFVNANGWLQTDDYSLDEYSPNGFTRGLVTLTFDDGHEENDQTALPIMTQHGFKSTQCYATQFIEGQPQSIIDKVLAFHNAGHEICSHSVTHPFMTSLNSTDLNFEAEHSQDYLENLVGVPVRNFATPFGDYNNTVINTLDNYYQSHRTVDEGFNSKDNFNIYRLRVQNILDTTTASQVQDWVEQALADKTWLVLVYHRVADDPGLYDTTPELFAQHMQVIDDSNITVKTWQQALDEVLPQL